MKLGVLGGTFDPIHVGHLMAAEEARWALELEQVLFVPAGVPPHKRGKVISPVADRVAMVELAIADNPAFALSRVDVDRAGPAYTVDTLALLKQRYGSAAELHFIIGLDSLHEFLTWHKPQGLLPLARLVAVTRPGYTAPDLDALERTLPGASERIIIVPIPAIGVSASDLRRRVAVGQPIKYQVPASVEAYIRAHNLYRS